MHGLDRLAALLEKLEIVVVAVHHDGALADLDLLRRVGGRLQLHDLLLGELFEERPAQLAHQQERGGEDRAAVARMALGELAAPFGIEQVGKALWRLLALHLVGVVADDAQPRAHGRVQPVGIAVLGRIMLRHVLRHVGREPAVAIPVDVMRRVGAVRHVDREDAARLLLRDALEDALGARALDPHRDAGIFRLEHLAETLRHRQLERGVERDLALFPRRLDQGWRDRTRLGRGGVRWLGEHGAGRERGRSLQDVAPGQSFSHGVPPAPTMPTRSPRFT